MWECGHGLGTQQIAKSGVRQMKHTLIRVILTRRQLARSLKRTRLGFYLVPTTEPRVQPPSAVPDPLSLSLCGTAHSSASSSADSSSCTPTWPMRVESGYTYVHCRLRAIFVYHVHRSHPRGAVCARVFQMAARLVLEDGSQYEGKLFGAARSVPGEVGEPS